MTNSIAPSNEIIEEIGGKQITLLINDYVFGLA